MKESRRAAPFQPLTDAECGSPPGREVNRTWGLPWQSAYSYFRKWKRHHFFDYWKDELLIHRRLQPERKITPLAVAIESQRIKKTSFVSWETGIDGNKPVNGLGVPDEKDIWR